MFVCSDGGGGVGSFSSGGVVTVFVFSSGESGSTTVFVGGVTVFSLGISGTLFSTGCST